MIQEKTISSLELTKALYEYGRTSHTSLLPRLRMAFMEACVPEHKYKTTYGHPTRFRSNICYNVPESVAIIFAGDRSDVVKALYNRFQQPLLSVAMQLTGYQTANKLNEGQEDMKNALTTISTQPKKETQMNVMTTMNNAPVKTMSSIEIAALTGKRHDHVMRDVKSMLEGLEMSVPTFGDTYINHQNGQKYPCFNLPKDLTLTLVSGYNVVLRKAIIDRWMELEATVSPVNLNDPSTLRTVLLSYTEKVIELQAAIIEQAPKVAFHDAVAVADNCQTWDEVARVIGVGKMKMLKELREREIIMKSNLPYQRCINAGYFDVVETAFTDSGGVTHINAKVLVTGKGVIYISKLFNCM